MLPLLIFWRVVGSVNSGWLKKYLQIADTGSEGKWFDRQGHMVRGTCGQVENLGSFGTASLHQWCCFWGLQLHEQLYRWSWSHFSKLFDKTIFSLKYALTERHVVWGEAERSHYFWLLHTLKFCESTLILETLLMEPFYFTLFSTKQIQTAPATAEKAMLNGALLMTKIWCRRGHHEVIGWPQPYVQPLSLSYTYLLFTITHLQAL